MKKLQREETQGCQAEREQETDPGLVLLEVSISCPPTLSKFESFDTEILS